MAVSAMAGIPALKEVYTQLKTRMDKAVEDFRANLAAARTGRATVTCWIRFACLITDRRCR